MTPGPREQQLLDEARGALGLRNLVLAVHDASFPAGDDDLGRGAPGSAASAAFLAFARALGFNGLQLGPQGLTAAGNASPYDGTVFSRNPLSIALGPLVAGGLLDGDALAAAAAGRGTGRRVEYGAAFAAQYALLEQAWRRHQGRPAGDAARSALQARLAAFMEHHRSWLERDALYEPLCREHGAPSWREWREDGRAHADQRLWHPRPEARAAARARRAALAERHAPDLRRYAFWQLLAHEQHEALRETARGLGLKLYGDLQIGLSEVDVWAHREVLLEDYRMGAPPSRTNPEGQPWNYAVLDPGAYYEGEGEGRRRGPALRFVAARLTKMLAEYDSVRIDHPHGHVDPWVYQPSAFDPFAAVRAGARLFSSPGLPDHPALAAYAIARPGQIAAGEPRHADGWVRELDEAQVEAYCAVFDILLSACREHGRNCDDLVCEVLSTQPFPVKRVMERYGLGRFRVTQKADLDDPGDLYRSENAAPADWIMVGNHDTPPLWLLVERWGREGTLPAQAAYLAGRLEPREDERAAFAARLLADPGLLAQAKLTDLLAGPAQNVMVFFSDLLGLHEVYNTPGTISDDNWSLRVPPAYASEYFAALTRHRAFNVPLAMAWALRARGHGPGGLPGALETLGAAWAGAPARPPQTHIHPTA